MVDNRLEKSGETEAIVIAKAAPQIGTVHGETVCCAALNLAGDWLRLYPVQFRHLEDAQKFRRWDRIAFRWRKPSRDQRFESRHVDQDSIRIVGKLKKPERSAFLSRCVVTNLQEERQKGRSLALLKAKIREFCIEQKSAEEFDRQAKEFASLHEQQDLFRIKHLVPYKPAPYKFKYRYTSDDGEHFGTCQDWEMEATYFNWSREYGEPKALEKMQMEFGERYPQDGMLLAMGTHSLYPDVWLINGVVRFDETGQLPLL
jgi:hypothetical protein